MLGGFRRISRAVAIASFVLLGVASTGPVHAEEGVDRVHLKNGSVFEGQVIEEREDSVLLGLPSESGGAGRVRIPREMIRLIERAASDGRSAAPANIRDAWFLLRSGGRIVGTRHLRLRHVRDDDGAGWRLEEDLVQFPSGPSMPLSRVHRMETVDLAFFPRRLHHREVGEPSAQPGGPGRYERILTGPVRAGAWTVLERENEEGRQISVPVPEGVRGRLGTREDLLRRRAVGLVDVTFLDAARPGLATVRAGYTALDLHDEHGAPYDEFVWEEDGVRRTSRFRDAEVVEEWISEGVVAVPASEAQAAAALAEAERQARQGEVDLIRLAEQGIALRLPGETWTLERAEAPPGVQGWRKVATIESRFFVSDVRVEWDPQGARTTPDPAETEARLLQRLRIPCPDLQVLEARRPVSDEMPGAWRLALSGTLKGERVRTLAVVVDRGEGRVLLLAACPERAWSEARDSIERLLASLRML